MNYIKGIFDQCGLSYVYANPNLYSVEWIIATIDQILKDQFRQEWLSSVENSAKSLCYRIFKDELSFEKYLTLLPRNQIYVLCKFRCGNHRLPVETGRWQNVPRADRFCHLCDSADIGDEFHYIFECTCLKRDRERLLPAYFCRNYNALKFNQLFNSVNVVLLEKLVRFIKIISVKVSPPG